MTIELPRELEELVLARVGRGNYASLELVRETGERRLECEREELQRAVEEGSRDIEHVDYAHYDEHTVKDLAKDGRERGLKRIADLQKAGRR